MRCAIYRHYISDVASHVKLADCFRSDEQGVGRLDRRREGARGIMLSGVTWPVDLLRAAFVGETFRR